MQQEAFGGRREGIGYCVVGESRSWWPVGFVRGRELEALFDRGAPGFGEAGVVVRSALFVAATRVVAPGNPIELR